MPEPVAFHSCVPFAFALLQHNLLTSSALSLDGVFGRECIRAVGLSPHLLNFVIAAVVVSTESLCLHRVVPCGASVSSCKQTLEDWIHVAVDSSSNVPTASLVWCEQRNNSALIYAIKNDDRDRSVYCTMCMA